MAKMCDDPEMRRFSSRDEASISMVRILLQEEIVLDE
jgi:hypothetical protein